MRLYRLMKRDDDGRPRIGTAFGCLGVRPPGRGPGMVADLDVDAGGFVFPGPDGLSTFDAPLRPDRRHACWGIEGDEFLRDGRLVIVPSRSTSGRFHVTPARIMTLVEYQSALAATQDFWTVVAEEDKP